MHKNPGFGQLIVFCLEQLQLGIRYAVHFTYISKFVIRI